MSVFASLCCVLYYGYAHFAATTGNVHRVLYPDGTTKLEWQIDSQSRMHGFYRAYHPSGRLKGESRMVHGELGEHLYQDDSPDEEPED
jgi:hypothetical protein